MVNTTASDAWSSLLLTAPSFNQGINCGILASEAGVSGEETERGNGRNLFALNKGGIKMEILNGIFHEGGGGGVSRSITFYFIFKKKHFHFIP